MASINVREQLFQYSDGRVKEVKNYKLLDFIHQVGERYQVSDSQFIIKILTGFYRQNAELGIGVEPSFLKTENELTQLLTSLLKKYSIEDAIKAIDMWNIMRENMSFFQIHMCWVTKKKNLYLRNSCDSRYVTWMKEGKTLPILRRWFNRYYIYRFLINERQINALMDIVRPLNIGKEMSQEEIESLIVMDKLISKDMP